ncbi:unnamed protein product [Heterosigma akashiwo]|mmetsp:Transcript_31144/g.45636  ORF Transcript_31144/g.45636 Transcript_31144/m.45636 type:complete len:211 (-) Transcript_31144:263-895(-)
MEGFNRWWCCILFALSFIPDYSRGIILEIQNDQKRCIFHENPAGQNMEFKLALIQEEAAGLETGVVLAQVFSPKGRKLFQDEKLETFPEFTKYSPRKKALQEGLYEVCFTATGAAGPGRRVVLETEEEQDGLDANLKPLEKAFKLLDKKLDRITQEFDYMRTREARMAVTSGTTNDRIQWFSFLSITVLIGISCYQIIHLKSFFLSKKLL